MYGDDHHILQNPLNCSLIVGASFQYPGKLSDPRETDEDGNDISILLNSNDNTNHQVRNNQRLLVDSNTNRNIR